MKKLLSSVLLGLLKLFFGREKITLHEYPAPSKILIIRPHNQLGDMIAGSVMFRAVKEKYPDVKIHLLVSPMNIAGISKNNFVDELFSYDKKKLRDFSFLKNLYRFLRDDYDIVITPVVVSVSFTSNMLAGFAKGKIKIGAESLDGVMNESSFFFDVRHEIDFRSTPQFHVWDRILKNIPGLYDPENVLKTDIHFTSRDAEEAEKFLEEKGYDRSIKLIGIHPGAGKPPNVWPAENFAYVINHLAKKNNIFVYITGSSSESNLFEILKGNVNIQLHKFYDYSIGELTALAARSDLFITNDTGIMHVAGTTAVAQISLFGPTPPEVWSPRGENKFFIQRGGDIKNITPEEVSQLADKIIAGGTQ